MEEGLEKFGKSDEWRLRLKKNLCMERPINSTSNFPKIVESRMDTEGELQRLLEDKRKEVESMQNREKIRNHNLKSFCVSDESFAELERMCDKTASDPNSTLFHYLHSKNVNQNVITEVDEKKKLETNLDAEAEALVKLLNEFDVKESQPKEIIDLTQLEDVEAPSSFWEKSSENDTTLQTSPVKMIGLLRPSTIIEEGEGMSSSNVSFAITAECATSESGDSSCYETAHDNTDNDELKLQLREQEDIIESIDSRNSHNVKSSYVVDSSFDSYDSVLASACANESRINSPAKSSAINISESLKHDQYKGDRSDSPNFNDTIEEVEYMLKKGLEYIRAGSSVVLEMESNNSDKPVARKNVYEQKTDCSTIKKPSKYQVTDVRTPAKTNKSTCKKEGTVSAEREHFEMKPIPKLDVFQKPSGIPKISGIRQKPLHFKNIVSPIGTYMKNTGITPFLVSTQTNNCEDIHNTSAIRKLNNIQQKLKQLDIPENSIEVFSPRSLPKKAYISSDLKHVLDERADVKVPGGNSIQKYIEKALVPNVVCHNGKLKLPYSGFNRNKPLTQNLHNESKVSGRKTDINDLSLMSGDVSVYTIKNARKF